MTIPSLFSRMARMFAAQARMYCLSVLIVGVIGIAALTAISLWMIYGAGEGELDPRLLWQSMTSTRQLIAFFGLLFALWVPILLGARGVCRIATNQLAGKPTSLSGVVGDMAKFIPAALVYAILIGFPVVIGTSILLIPGIVIASLFVLVVPTGVIESLGAFAAFRRGISLGNRVFAKELLLTLASSALTVVLILFRIVFFDRFLPGTRSSLFALRFALTYIPSLLVLVLANICFTLLYHEARAAETPQVSSGPSAQSGSD